MCISGLDRLLERGAERSRGCRHLRASRHLRSSQRCREWISKLRRCLRVLVAKELGFLVINCFHGGDGDQIYIPST